MIFGGSPSRPSRLCEKLIRREVFNANVARSSYLKWSEVPITFHPEWLANTVLVKKKNKKWSMGVDYMSLNKVCPKDLFPLPRIDQVVDSTAGCETLCFLDVYSEYH
jgi:hypothetical protein